MYSLLYYLLSFRKACSMIRDSSYVRKYISCWAKEDQLARINERLTKLWDSPSFNFSLVPSEYEIQRDIQQQTGIIRSPKWHVDIAMAGAYAGLDFRKVSKLVSESEAEINLCEEFTQPYNVYARGSGRISFAYALSLISVESVMKVLTDFKDVVTRKSESIMFDSFLMDDRAFVTTVELIAEHPEYLDYPANWIGEIIK